MEKENTFDAKEAGLKKLQEIAIAHIDKIKLKDKVDAILTDDDRIKMLRSLASVDWVEARKILEKNPQFFDAEEPKDHPIFYAAMNPSLKILQEVTNKMMDLKKTMVPVQREAHPLFLINDLPMNVAARRGLVDNFCYLMTLSSWKSFSLENLVFECILHNSHKICKMVMDARPDLQNFVFVKLARNIDVVNDKLNGRPSSLAKFGIDSSYIAPSGDDYQGLFCFSLLKFREEKVDIHNKFSVSGSLLTNDLHARGRQIIDHYAKKYRKLGDGKFQESSLMWFEQAFKNAHTAKYKTLWFNDYEATAFSRQLKKTSTCLARSKPRGRI